MKNKKKKDLKFRMSRMENVEKRKRQKSKIKLKVLCVLFKEEREFNCNHFCVFDNFYNTENFKAFLLWVRSKNRHKNRNLEPELELKVPK